MNKKCHVERFISVPSDKSHFPKLLHMCVYNCNCRCNYQVNVKRKKLNKMLPNNVIFFSLDHCFAWLLVNSTQSFFKRNYACICNTKLHKIPSMKIVSIELQHSIGLFTVEKNTRGKKHVLESFRALWWIYFCLWFL